jgi:hypothetical protein
MLTLLFIISGIAAIAFIWAVMFGKPSKDEPLRPPIDEHEKYFYKDWEKEF